MAKSTSREANDALVAEGIESIPIVGFVGADLSYTHQATMEFFQLAELRPFMTPAALFEALHVGEISRGVLPAERPTSGMQAPVYQHLADERNREQPAVVVQEFYHHAGHALLGVPGVRRDRIRWVLTDDAAWSECTKWLARHVPKAVLEETSTTGWAAQEFKKRPEKLQRTGAVVASPLVAKSVGLAVLEPHIDDNERSLSRYLVVGLEGPQVDANKATIALMPNRSKGTLAGIFSILTEVDVLAVQMVPMRSVSFLDHRSLVVIDVLVEGGEPIWEVIPRLVNELDESPHALEAYVFGIYQDGRPRRQQALEKLAAELATAAMDPESSSSAASIMDIIRNGETEQFEMKSTLRWNLVTKTVEKGLAGPIVKTIAGFMNADGGQLLIGADDDGNILGIEHDMSDLKKPRTDDFRRALDDALRAAVRGGIPGRLEVTFPRVDGKTLCLIQVPPSKVGPVLALADNRERLYVRVGTATVEYGWEEGLRYIRERWPDS
jgi:prephenate dehydratase